MNVVTGDLGTLGNATLTPGSRLKENHTARSFAKNRPTRNLFKKYCGTVMPDEFLVNAAKQFVAEMYDPAANLTTRNQFVVKNRQSKVSASSAKDGAGALWIKLFSAYQGDECIVYGSLPRQFRHCEQKRS